MNNCKCTHPFFLKKKPSKTVRLQQQNRMTNNDLKGRVKC